MEMRNCGSLKFIFLYTWYDVKCKACEDYCHRTVQCLQLRSRKMILSFLECDFDLVNIKLVRVEVFDRQVSSPFHSVINFLICSDLSDPHLNAYSHHVYNELKMLEQFGGLNFVIKYECSFKYRDSEWFILEHVEHERPEKEIGKYELQWYGFCMFKALASLHKQLEWMIMKCGNKDPKT
ncbi:hypothetical protein M5K25_000526 [Dendrobium thyrsiflorum]|uniref:Uncharacterized protein n=1 Tax=Dendrobium thyrsiflorum TaxID=117978 RepID=A0ABD0VUT1_DENTH